VPYDYLIVGAGFAGATMARCLADAGKRVLIIDKRDHIGGNAYDYVNEHGVRIHKYGPHIFHTNSDAVFAFLSRFTEWRPYEHRVLASVGGKLVPFPINLTTLEMLGLEHLKPPPPSDKHPANAEEQCLQRVGPELYELFFKGYTTKMWGRAPSELDASVTARIPVRWDSRDDRYFTDKHQAMPRDGYTAMFERMLGHPGIEVELSMRGHVAALAHHAARLIWTGPIDEFYGHRFGVLPYRSMRFEESYKLTLPQEQTAAVTNFPDGNDAATRRTRWQVLDASVRRNGYTGRFLHTTREYPQAEGDPFYPIPARENRALYKRYEAYAEADINVTFLGRLGRYQYLNMDQVVAQALATSARLLGQPRAL
jgi:UDP-galactopyranose mutase